jgi:hypothetical protein
MAWELNDAAEASIFRKGGRVDVLEGEDIVEMTGETVA